MKETHGGVKYLNTRGNAALASKGRVLFGPSIIVQSVARATTPIKAQGTASIIQKNIEATDSVVATVVLRKLSIR